MKRSRFGASTRLLANDVHAPTIFDRFGDRGSRSGLFRGRFGQALAAELFERIVPEALGR